MNKSIFITKDKPEAASMDYDALRQEGIGLLQKLSPDIWTDHNVHDPGITILEYLCFGITDLGYRFNFPITDLLYAKDGKDYSPKNNAFFAQNEILPSAPLTLNDYRKLIIDRYPAYIQNAWIYPLYEQKEGYKGLYTIAIQINEENENKIDEDEIKALVWDLFSTQRNLCEDIESVVILEKLPIEVSARIELDPDASAEQVLADLLHHIEHYLVPEISFSSLEDLLAQGLSISQILEGPALKHGLIKDSDLKLLLRVINVSQIRDIIDETNGVSSVEQVRVYVEGTAQIFEDFEIPANTFLVLADSMLGDVEGHYPIVFSRNGKPIEVNIALAMQIMKGYIAKEYLDFNRSLRFSNTSINTEKNLKDIGDYFSIQRFFPAVYGIGPYGLARDATDLRQAQAQQLKGYLAFMEVLLADFLKRLTHIKKLFSIEKEDNIVNAEILGSLGASYIERLLSDVPDIKPLIIDPTTGARFDADTILANNKNERTLILERRNQFLNHLLARFAESVDESLLLPALDELEDPLAVFKSILDAKCRILQEYDALSRNRGLGLDYRIRPMFSAESEFTWEMAHVSGFKKRIAYLLNIEECADRSLTGFFPFKKFKPEKIDAAKNTEKSKEGLPLRQLLKQGAIKSNYVIEENKEAENTSWSVYFKPPGLPDKRLLFQTDNEKEAADFSTRFIQDILQFNTASKGFSIVEHILLRPRLSDAIQLELEINEAVSDGEIKVKFISIGFESPEKVQKINDSLLVTASKSSNYEVLKDGAYYFVVLKESDRPILVSDNCKGPTEADKLVKMLVAFFSDMLKNNPGKLNRFVKQRMIPAKGFLAVNNDFYSHRLSIVLPNWPTDFMEKDFQLNLEHLVAQHIPAHLRVDFHWRPWPDMVDFERRYKHWLETVNSLHPDNKSLNDASYELVEFLSPEEIDTSKLPTQGETESGLSPEKITSIWEKYKYRMLFSPEDLQVFERINEKTESWLKKHKVFNWSLLASADADKLIQLLSSSNQTMLSFDVSSWIEQAKLIMRNDWEHLEQLQRTLLPPDTPEPRVSKIEQLFKQKLKSLYLT